MIFEIVRFIVDKKASVDTALKDKSDLTFTVKIQLFCLNITKFMRKYLTFNLSDSSFDLLVKNKIVIIENYYILLDGIKYSPIQETMEATS